MMTPDPAIMPTAKTPTAIESTTRMARVLLPHRSAATLRHRGLATRVLRALRRDVLGLSLLRDLADRVAKRLGLGDQRQKRLPVERNRLGARLGRSRDGREGFPAVQQLDLAEELAPAHRAHHELATLAPLDAHVHLAFRDEVEVLDRISPPDDHRAGWKLQRLEAMRDADQLLFGQRWEDAGQVLFDHRAVGQHDGT